MSKKLNPQPSRGRGRDGRKDPALSKRFNDTMDEARLFYAEETINAVKQEVASQSFTFGATPIIEKLTDGFRNNPDRVTGSQVREGARTRGYAIADKADENLSVWQASAEMIWKRHPHLTKRRVGQLVAEKTGDNPNTIRRRIQRP